ncbi:hypothetical protein Trydic_g3946 [Trypoxylus dichotomus]
MNAGAKPNSEIIPPVSMRISDAKPGTYTQCTSTTTVPLRVKVCSPVDGSGGVGDSSSYEHVCRLTDRRHLVLSDYLAEEPTPSTAEYQTKRAVDLISPMYLRSGQKPGSETRRENGWPTILVGECAEGDRNISVTATKSQLNQTTLSSASKSITRIVLGTGKSPAP